MIALVNASCHGEPLFGLTEGAINRWANTHRSTRDHAIAEILIDAANSLQCLADKSLALEADLFKTDDERLAESMNALVIACRVRDEENTAQADKDSTR